MMETITVSPEDIRHWNPQAYEDLQRSYDAFNIEMDDEDRQTFQEYLDEFCFHVGNGYLYMTCQDEQMVWYWEDLSLGCADGDSYFREFNSDEWCWAQGRPYDASAVQKNT